MRKYIITTTEGYTIAPNGEDEVENLQVLGVVENVNNKDEAIIKLFEENEWISEAKFSEYGLMVYELL
jgi:hypothetical protein